MKLDGSCIIPQELDVTAICGLHTILDNNVCHCDSKYYQSQDRQNCFLLNSFCSEGQIISAGGYECLNSCPPDQMTNDNASACVCRPGTYYDYSSFECVEKCDYYLRIADQTVCAFIGDVDCPYYKIVDQKNECIHHCDESNVDINSENLCHESNPIYVLLVIFVIVFLLTSIIYPVNHCKKEDIHVPIHTSIQQPCIHVSAIAIVRQEE
ncbi:Growth_factor receptor cysteine-rich domain superfamily [Hexamita inflata]|uniref:Growth factor receptor cysteine-rich domain superfamily n=1 Tax=Hexamita inflata TaxID=28002 RepID=A0AA86VSF5_9EUKA|nr:Growth factor receptor cysteine-rich domain superfamily [Hexamita inflata]